MRPVSDFGSIPPGTRVRVYGGPAAAPYLGHLLQAEGGTVVLRSTREGEDLVRLSASEVTGFDVIEEAHMEPRGLLVAIARFVQAGLFGILVWSVLTLGLYALQPDGSAWFFIGAGAGGLAFLAALLGPAPVPRRLWGIPIR